MSQDKEDSGFKRCHDHQWASHGNEETAHELDTREMSEQENSI